MKDILIFIPCYNEANRLDVESILKFVQMHTQVDLCLVDDGSTDDTSQIIQNLENSTTQIFSYKLKHNIGKGPAVRRALLDTLDLEDKYKYFGYFDADLSTPLDFSLKLENELLKNSTAMMAMGSRMDVAGDIDAKLHRRWIGKLVSSMINRILHYSFHDTQCGAKLFPSVQGKLLFEKPFISSWLFDIEIILRIRDRVAPASVSDFVLEIPVDTWHHVDGSKITPSYFPKMLKEMREINRAYN